MSTKALLGGVPLLALDDARWPRRAGIDPVMQSFVVSPDGAAELLATIQQGRTVDLEIDEQTVSGLYVLREMEGPDPFVRRVVVADRRIRWPFRHVLRRYNMRRKVGVRRRDADWGAPLQVVEVPAIQYARYSTRFGNHWRPVEVFRDVLEQIGESLVQVDGEVESLAVPVEDLVLDDSGDGALRRVLALLPGASIDVLPEGGVRLFSTLSGKEKDIVGDGLHDPTKPGAAGYEIMGGGHVAYILENYQRPREVHCLFSMEVEVRFDFLEDGEEDFEVDDPPRRIRNMVQVPDYTLTLTNGDPPVVRGAYVELGTYLDAINAGGGFQVTEQLLRRAFVPENDLWNCLAIAGELDLQGETKVWASRFGALRRDYRQLFQIERHWIDRMLSMRDYLVATIDLTSGQRSPALVFSDYSARVSSKARFLQAARGEGIAYAYNVDGYPGENTDPQQTDLPAPAKVEIVDADQGIIRVSYHLDPWGNRDYIFPSKINIGANRNMRPHNRNTPVAFNAVGSDGRIPELTEDAQVAVFLTCVPAAPNDNRQLYRVVVKPNDVKGLLPVGAHAGLDHAYGPPLEVRIPLETARIRWQTAKSGLISRIFGVGGVPPESKELSDLVINDADQDAVGASAASLRNLSRAAAAAVYARYHARVMGSMSGPLRTDLPLEGALQEIQHVVRTDGATISSYHLQPQIDPGDLFSFLDSGTRQIVLRQAQGPFGST